MCVYGTEAEVAEIASITNLFPYHAIVNPNTLQSQADKGSAGMRYFFHVIDYCDALVFSRLLGKITIGVGLEVNYALTRLIPVYQLDDGKVRRITMPVEFLSREDTVKQYALWRTAGNEAKQANFDARKE